MPRIVPTEPDTTGLYATATMRLNSRTTAAPVTRRLLLRLLAEAVRD